MGLDMAVRAVIRDKTGKAVTKKGYDDEYFDLCYWRGHMFYELASDLFCVCCRHNGSTAAFSPDIDEPLPYEAVFDIYSEIVESCGIPSFSEDGHIDESRYIFERMNLDNASKLVTFMRNVSYIQERNRVFSDIFSDAFVHKDEYVLFCNDPQSYSVELRFYFSC